MAERIAAMFATARAEKRAALLPYMTAGLPSAGASLDMFAAMADGGADGFELGIPYSDPMMDGPTIHEAGLVSLAGGATTYSSLQLVEQVTARTGKPVVVMTYVNPVLAMGVRKFATLVSEAGGSGLILADLPVDEADVVSAACADAGIGLVLFVAPTTDDVRLASVVARRPLFVYGIAELGVTGRREKGSSRIAGLSKRVRAATDTPLVLGVGISSPEQAAEAAAVGDGVIVGSVLVRQVLDAATPAAAASALTAATTDLAAAVRR